MQAGELPAHLDAEYEAARLRVLLDGLRLQLITTPRQTSASWALAVLDDHLTALTAPPAADRTLPSPAPSGADGSLTADWADPLVIGPIGPRQAS